MATRPEATKQASILRRAMHPPVREVRFWMVQAMVVVIAGIHLLVDIEFSRTANSFPVGLPVALLIVPVLYAALRYGLTGSAATGVWATLLWLPDLLLPNDLGHVGSDVVNLALVDLVAFFVGHRIEAERLSHARIAQITSERLAAETLYRQLFETNSAPIFILDHAGVVQEVNPAAKAMFGEDSPGQLAVNLCGIAGSLTECAGRIVSLLDGRDYRLELVTLSRDSTSIAAQLILEDVTEELSGERRATRYAQLVVQAEEEQRLRLSRELHDEPLQLFLHLSRRLESLAEVADVPLEVVAGLVEARSLSLKAAGRLRSLARDLRPPALDQLGFVAALSSLVSDVEEEVGLLARLEVSGIEIRLPPEMELGAFRIAQEAIRNAVRHSGASHLIVGVEFRAEALALRVLDDGDGFVSEMQDTLQSGHLGLLGMRERARLLGGDIDLHSAIGKGTVVNAVLPIGRDLAR
ncbi:MAG: sensor histidine kinase [Ferrimicrobium sp.]